MLSRGVSVLLGVLVLSPAAVYALRAGQALGGVVFVLLWFLEVMAIAGLVWGLKSSSGAALLGALVAAPWLFYFGTEAGPWAYLIAGPEYLLLTGVGWYGYRREKQRALRWPGALAPTLAVAYALLAPFVRGYRPS
ncbi:MAG TPA: hypothetical protein VFG53_19870 [Anaeromyxobacter sp.]|nr:hypothetical protein [Anaeromyxobacter sp.]